MDAAKTFLSMLVAVFLGAGYGVFARFIIKDPSHHSDHPIVYTFMGVSLAYLFLVPYALGVLTAALYPRAIRSMSWRWVFWLLMPCVSVGLMIVVVMALAWEGAICIVMASP